jgi:glucoamylase
VRGRRLLLTGVITVIALVGVACTAQRPDAPPGSPGVDTGYAPADKQGFGTARSARSPVWFTLGHGGTTELFYPNLSTPASRRLQLVVSDGAQFAQRLSDVPTRTERVDGRVPSYRQVSTGDGWEATATYVTDPARASVLVDLSLRSQNGEPLQAYAIHEPTLAADGSDDKGRSEGDMLVASDQHAASALTATPGFTATSSGYLATSDGWTDLVRHKKLTKRYPEAGPGNIGQVGQLPLNGLDSSHAVLTLSFGGNEAEAIASAKSTGATGFQAISRSYGAGWQQYVSSLRPIPSSLTDTHQREVYWSSVTTLAASEDKRSPGAFIASPSEPWAFGQRGKLAPTPGVYHLVWPRDLYQHATGLLAAGDSGAANRAWDFLRRVQLPDGHWPQNLTTSGAAYWTKVQLDETALPIVLAWQLGRSDAPSLDAVRTAAEFLVNFSLNGHPAPYSEQERWENQPGYSPATIAATIAGLICAADLLDRAGDGPAARRYRTVADQWAAQVDGWTVTSNGPDSPAPYYLRVTTDGKPNEGSTYDVGDNYPRPVDQRTQVDPSFLELVRLGIKRWDDPVILNTNKVIDTVLAEQTPSGQHWHRFTNDGYGEAEDGSQWDIGKGRTYGRLWPILAGERGEYELLAGQADKARKRLASMAMTANEGLMLPEQIWDDRAPSGATAGGPRPGTPTASATPLAWTHGQYVRLAWSIDAGAPVEQPSVVANRYARH